MDPILVVDCATRLGAGAAGRVSVCGSHGGVYPAWLAARAGVRAVILNDAGVGKDGAGIGGLEWLERLGLAACAVDAASARIGDGADMLALGTLSHANAQAEALGCRPGMTCREAAERLADGAPVASARPPELGESRERIPSTGRREVWTVDSVSLVRESDRRAIVLTGSDGGLPGGLPDDMLAVDVFAAFFNDAGGGKDGAGYARLAVLDPRSIAAGTVWAGSARIGDGRSTWETGVLSRVNATGHRLGLSEGMSAREAVARLVGLA